MDTFLIGNMVPVGFDYSDDFTKLYADCSNYEKRVVYEVSKETKRVLRDNIKLLYDENEKI